MTTTSLPVSLSGPGVPPTPWGAVPLSVGEQLQFELSKGIPRKAGVLSKLGGTSLGITAMKSWKERWVVCDGPYLKYFESPKDYEGKPKGVFELEGARVAHVKHPKSESPFAFELATASGGKETFVAHNNEEFMSWMNAIQGVIDVLNKFPGPISLHAPVQQPGPMPIPQPRGPSDGPQQGNLPPSHHDPRGPPIGSPDRGGQGMPPGGMSGSYPPPGPRPQSGGMYHSPPPQQGYGQQQPPPPRPMMGPPPSGTTHPPGYGPGPGYQGPPPPGYHPSGSIPPHTGPGSSGGGGTRPTESSTIPTNSSLPPPIQYTVPTTTPPQHQGTDSVVISPSPVPLPLAQESSCANCNASLDPGARFCGECGHRV